MAPLHRYFRCARALALQAERQIDAADTGVGQRNGLTAGL